MSDKELTRRLIEVNQNILKWTFRLRTATLFYGRYTPIECINVINELEKERQYLEGERDQLRGIG